MKKIFTHWTIGLLTLAILTIIGLGDPQIKEILRLKSFDLILQSETKEVSPETQELLSKIKVKNLFILPIPDITNLYSKMKIETTDADGNNLPPEAVYSQVASPAKFLIMEQIPDTDGELKPFVQFGNSIVFDLKEMNKFLKEQSDEKLEELRLKAEDEALLLKMNQVPKQTTIDPFRASVNPSMPEDF